MISIEVLNIGRWTVECDVLETEKYYTDYHTILDNCKCEMCQSYCDVIKDENLEIVKLLKLFGIDPLKGGELYCHVLEDDQMDLYGIFYNVAGRIINGYDCWVESCKTESSTGYRPDFYTYSDNISIGISASSGLIPDGFPNESFTVDLMVKLPRLSK